VLNQGRAVIASSENNLGMAEVVRRDATRLGLRLPGQCLELLKKEESGRTQVSKRKRSDEYRRGTAKRRGEAKTEAEIDTLTSKLTGQQYYKQKQLWTDSSINIHDREALVRNIVNEKELDGKRSKYSKSVANAAGKWGIVCHFCNQILSDRKSGSVLQLKHSELKQKLTNHRKSKQCLKTQEHFAIGQTLREAQKFYVFVTDQTEPLKGIIDQLANNSSGTRGEITYRFTEGPDTTTQRTLTFADFQCDLLECDIILRSR
jgi:hypothetical protein